MLIAVAVLATAAGYLALFAIVGTLERAHNRYLASLSVYREGAAPDSGQCPRLDATPLAGRGGGSLK